MFFFSRKTSSLRIQIIRKIRPYCNRMNVKLFTLEIDIRNLKCLIVKKPANYWIDFKLLVKFYLKTTNFVKEIPLIISLIILIAFPLFS